MCRLLFVLRRGALALALAAGVLVTFSGLAAASEVTITASGTPPLPSNDTGTASSPTAGSLTVTLGSTLAFTATTTLSLYAYVVPSTGPSEDLHWGTSVEIASESGVHVNSYLVADTELIVRLTDKSAPTATIEFSTVRFADPGRGDGEAYVRATIEAGTGTAAVATFYAHPTVPTTTLRASGTPPSLRAGAVATAVATWTLTMTGTEAGPSGWSHGDSVKITVEPPAGATCATDAMVAMFTKPTVTVETTSDVSTPPTVSWKLTSSCSPERDNELIITFTNTGVFNDANQGSVTLGITGIKYSVGATAAGVGTGDVLVTASFSVLTPPGSTQITATDAANATIAPTGGGGSGTSGAGTPTLTANTPPVAVPAGTSAVTISQVDIAETGAGQLHAGYVCATLGAGTFDTVGEPTVAVRAGNGAVASTVTLDGADGTEAPAVEFEVTKASTTASTYVLSNLLVDAPETTGTVDLTVTEGTSSDCSADTIDIGSVEAFSVAGTPVTRIYGETADATAAAELEHEFDPGGSGCPGTQNSRPVVLATDGGFADALASAYLASTLHTGELLTSPTTLSSAAVDAVEHEGITKVYVVGGSLAVSTTVVDRLEDMTVDACGGGTLATSSSPDHVQVTRISGATADATAEWVADYPPATDVGAVALTDAYAGTNQTGGVGKYNETAGSASPAPATGGSLPTAILATASSFQDAEAASALAYADHLPVLLTTSSKLSPAAAAALGNLGVKQVVVMGGPDAVADAVVSSLEGLGLSVLRVAGRTSSATAVELADLELAPAAGGLGFGWSSTGSLTVARGDYYADGLAGAVVAAGASASSAAHPEPLMLTTDATTVGPYLTAFLLEAGEKGVDDTAAAKIDALTVLGGPAALSQASVDAMLADL